MIVTIDGPAGSGKSTVARRLAGRLGFEFLNTGAMYRAVALACVRGRVDLSDAAAVAGCVRGAAITFPGGRPHLDGEDVAEALRSEEASAAASRVALVPEVRGRLVEMQREFARGRDVVTEGRDQGTVVFPDAEVKVFLTATAETRANRRHAELAALGGAAPDEASYAAILATIRDRDDRDLRREIAPLRPAADAVEFDTSELTVEEVVAGIERLVRERRG